MSDLDKLTNDIVEKKITTVAELSKEVEKLKIIIKEILEKLKTRNF